MKKNSSKFKKLLRKLNSRQGWAILVTTVFIMIIVTMASIGPALRTTVHLKNLDLNVAVSRSEDMILATSSPIRNKIVKEVYNRVQQQLVDHLRKAQSGQPYVCQGVLTPPSSMGTSSSNLASQFGLCEPEKIFEGLDGATNKTIDFLNAFYPEHKTQLADPSLEQARKSIVYQLQNDYEYTLRTIYIGQKVMPRGRFGNEREERYQWSVRADVAMHTNKGEITRGLVIYYDVTLTNNFYINGFNGAGNACNFNQTNTFPCPNMPPNDPKRFSCAILVAQDNSTGVAGVIPGYDASNFPAGLPNGLAIIDLCETGGSFNVIECPAENNQTLRLVVLKSTRPQIGCASANTGRQGISGLDPSGYVFFLTARITHIGSTYN
ncbi:MAG: hypothetical protein IPK14_22100 [Blastocatellia bacterium]|nr:hypothetical protein [Blastocatellia bacterium]